MLIGKCYGKASSTGYRQTALVDLVFEHYEKFDAKYKSVLPLKMVYVPQTVEE
jgi:hypothetical protein